MQTNTTGSPPTPDSDPEVHETGPLPIEPSRTLVVPAPVGRPRLLAGVAIGIVVVGSFTIALIRSRQGPSVSQKRVTRPAAGAPAATTEHTEVELAPQVARTAAGLRRHLELDPTDLETRRELAVLLVENEQFVEAFRESELLLATEPEDADGLWVQAVVRLRMGQNQRAIESLDRALASHPSHVPSFTSKGLALLRMGDPGSAVAVWETGLRAAGGHDPEIERLLAASRSPASSNVLTASAARR